MKTHNEMHSYMRTTCCTIICLAALALTSVQAQTLAGGPGTLNITTVGPRVANTEPGALTKFKLDFPGGTPGELVAAIEKAAGRPLNVIIPIEFANTELPALKMTGVNVAQLFQALEAASPKIESYRGAGPYYGPLSSPTREPTYGFKTQGNESEDSIWYFYVNEPHSTPPPKVCRFYSLAPYIDRGMSVDDITTAIETGWKMLGETYPPIISFHKDTKLLIAVGEPSKLEIIDAVLKALEPPNQPPGAPAPAVKPAEKPKTGK